MLDNLSAMASFARVVDEGSFSRAAIRLGLSKSAVSKQVARLEDRLGTRLLNRSTRRLSLTEAGLRLYERCQRIIAEAEAAEAEAGSLQSDPSGLLRVTTGVSFGQLHLARHLPALLDRHPGLAIDLVLNDRVVDMVEEGYDVALRIGRLADSSLIARRLAPVRRILAAAPAYLERHGAPSCPRDLQHHACLGYSLSLSGTVWALHGPDGVHNHRFQPRVVANNGDSLSAMAAGGLGIVHMPTFILARYMRRGELVRVLPGYELQPAALYAVYPPGRPLAAKVRAFIDFAVETFTDQPYWDRPYWDEPV
ncbi:LysR family transcriptional regulator [Thalassobaculum fulvum]|uniref:LysR family transcriptional regulator n=1 Tax=Thalassobaculum fulvum TaxID=1633335 RepID=A0A919CTU1_9PROT|nr:LysR family transcriptional regulator [Thalassobaculum fulvum]GHD62902.1 LysR family transcriptional regulator [Thalassobaculum fulvum]